MQIEERKVTRRKLVGWLGVLSLFTMAGGAFRGWKTKKPQTVKMLTEDGKLVEIDARLLQTGKKKVSDKELQSWIKKDKKSDYSIF
jgi:hypothetical protein